MNGATAELCAKIRSAPNTTRSTRIGVSHHHLFFEKNRSSSPRMPIRLATSAMNGICIPSCGNAGLHWLFNQTFTEHENVQPASDERAERLSRRVDDRFTFEIERRIQHHRHAGRLTECLDQLVICGAQMVVHGLQPSSTVDMGNCRHEVLLAFVHIHDVQHEASRIVLRRVSQVEVLFCPFGENRRGKRTERLTELDLDVDDVLHVRASRISENTSTPERARSPFEPTVEPADDFACPEMSDHALDHRFGVFNLLIRDIVVAKKCVDGIRPMVLAPIGVLHDEPPWSAEHHMLCDECRTQRSASVAGGRLHIDVLEWCFFEQLGIRYAVQSHAAGQTKLLEAGLPLQVSRHLEEGLFGDELDARGDVGIVLVLAGQLREVRGWITEIRWVRRGLREEARATVARRTEEADELRAERPFRGALEEEVVQVELEAAICGNSHELVNLVDVAWFPEWRHAHHLVLTVIDLEAEEGGEGAVEQAERVRKPNLVGDPDRVALADASGRGRPLAHAIDREYGGFLEGRAQEGARCMRQMMLTE